MNGKGKAVTDLFNVILIETKNVCTRKCWLCKFGQVRQDEAIVEMDWETIERIIYNLRDLNYSGRISWFCINEPLMEKRMLKILKLTRTHCTRAFLSLITNGDLLSQALYRSLRTEGLDALGVSIYDDKTFIKVEQIKDERLVMLDMRHALPGHLENRQEARAFEDYQRKFVNRSCERPSA